MKLRNLLILFLAAVVLVGLAVTTSRNRSAKVPDAMGRNLLAGLAINDVQKIVVRSSGSSLTLARKDDVWVAPDKCDYPVIFDKIRGALLKLADLKIGQVVKITDNQKAALRMRTPVSESNGVQDLTGTLVEIKGENDKLLGQLLLGDSRRKKQEGAPDDYPGYPDGRYVSIDGGKNVFLVKEELDEFTIDSAYWLDTDVLNVSLGDITEVLMISTNGDAMKLQKSKDSPRLQLDGISGKEELDSDKMAMIESALGYFGFQDIADVKTDAGVTGLDKPAIFRVTTTNDLVYEVRIGKNAASSGGRYVQIAVTAADIKDMPAESAAKADEKDKEKPATVAVSQADRGKAAEQRAKEIGGKLAKWLYVVPSFKTDAMLSLRKDLVKPKEEPEKEDNKDGKGD